jgi:hypothetical protein
LAAIAFFGLAGLLRERVDARRRFLDRRLCAVSSAVTMSASPTSFAPGLDHHDAVAGAGDNEVEAAVAALFERRVDDVLALDEADADARERARERNRRERQRGRAPR